MYARQASREDAADDAPPAARRSASAPFAAVELDGLVVLQIIKHCSEAFPETVAGTLLGMDVNDKLEVTHRCVACA